MNHVAIRTAALLLLVVGAGCGLGDMTAAQGEVSLLVDALFQTVESEAWADSYASLCAPDFQKATSKEAYAKLGSVFRERLGPLGSKSLQGFHVRSNNGVVTAQAAYQGTFKQGTGVISVTYVKQNGVWLLLGLHVNSPLLVEDGKKAACASCGKPRPLDATFCPNCGVKSAAEPSTGK